MMRMILPPEENLWSSVPPGGDVVSVGRPRPDLPGQAEVRDLDEVGAHAEQVLRLHVAVKVAVFVHEGEALQHLNKIFQY